jgi:hypothetical protein
MQFDSSLPYVYKTQSKASYQINPSKQKLLANSSLGNASFSKLERSGSSSLRPKAQEDLRMILQYKVNMQRNFNHYIKPQTLSQKRIEEQLRLF